MIRNFIRAFTTRMGELGRNLRAVAARAGNDARDILRRTLNPLTGGIIPGRRLKAITFSAQERVETSQKFLKYLVPFSKLAGKGAILGGGFTATEYALKGIISASINTVEGKEDTTLTDENLADIIASPAFKKIMKDQHEEEERLAIVDFQRLEKEHLEQERQIEEMEKQVEEDKIKIVERELAIKEKHKKVLREMKRFQEEKRILEEEERKEEKEYQERKAQAENRKKTWKESYAERERELEKERHKLEWETEEEKEERLKREKQSQWFIDNYNARKEREREAKDKKNDEDGNILQQDDPNDQALKMIKDELKKENNVKVVEIRESEKIRFILIVFGVTICIIGLITGITVSYILMKSENNKIGFF